QALRLSFVKQERHHDRQEHRREDRRCVSGTRSRASGRLPGVDGASAGAAWRYDERYIAKVGGDPPPQAKNRLRNLSQLGVVRIASGSEVLLPGHVPGFLEHQGAQSDHPVRRGLYRPTAITPAQAAADQYIAERQAERENGLNMLKHTR